MNVNIALEFIKLLLLLLLLLLLYGVVISNKDCRTMWSLVKQIATFRPRTASLHQAVRSTGDTSP